MKKFYLTSIKYWSAKEVSAEHKELLQSGERQSDEDIELARRMLSVQAKTLSGTHLADNETVSGMTHAY